MHRYSGTPKTLRWRGTVRNNCRRISLLELPRDLRSRADATKLAGPIAKVSLLQCVTINSCASLCSIKLWHLFLDAVWGQETFSKATYIYIYTVW